MKFKSYIEWHMYHKILNSYSSQGYVIEEAEKLAERKTQSNKIQSIIKSYENKRDRENKADRERAKMDKEQKINFIIEQEKQHHNSWKWILKADTETVNDLYEYWTQEMEVNKNE
jgi:hypothetical protein|tara:strand:- start:1020 stop:1364 length:345 start_codon:yes stop_codon:yes gene_type:complete